MKIIDYIQKYWNKNKIQKWEYLFKTEEKDTNLYFILTGEVLLTINWNNIALVWENEILWEKSFIELSAKPIDAVAKTDVNYLVITVDEFNNIESQEKELFLKELVLFVSNRVYLLNSIIKNISTINLNIIDKTINFELLQNIFSSFFELNEIHVYKYVWDSIMSIFESNFNTESMDYLQKYNKPTNIFNSLWQGKYIIKSWDYCFVLKWKNISSEYIMNNVILNSIASFSYLWWLLEKQKDENSQNFLD